MAKKRVYEFDLPIELEGIQLALGIDFMHRSAWWGRIPLEIRNRALNARSEFGGKFVLTREDLDSIDDATLREITNMANKAWHYEEVPDVPA